MPRRGREDTIRASHSTWFKGVLGAAAEMTKQAVEISKGLGKQAVEAYDEWRSEDDEQPALCYQVITAAGKFDKVHMDDSISGLEPTDKFVVCGIMGPQNTGKSTLLNFLVSSTLCDTAGRDRVQQGLSSELHTIMNSFLGPAVLTKFVLLSSVQTL